MAAKADTNLVVMRRETKYHIAYQDYIVLAEKLSKLIEPDKFSQNGKGYIVRSLYFDNYGSNDFFDKDIGCFYRKKLRIRIYDPNQDRAKIEIKEKFGSNQRKRSAWLTRNEVYEVINGNPSVLLGKGNDFLDEVYALIMTEGYHPAVTVEYDRRAYVYHTSNVRITFDGKVRANYGNFDLFDPDMQFVEVTPEVIMEVKYSGFMPQFIYDIIGSYNANNDSVSKYYDCRDYI